jgi:hypothetical protein
VPRAEIASSRVGDDGDEMAAQPVRLALRLLSGVSCLHGRQLLYLHGVGNRSPTCVGVGARALCSRRASWPTYQSESEGGRARRRLVIGIPVVN